MQRIIVQWRTDANEPILLISQSFGGSLAATLEISSSNVVKSTYFIKVADIPIELDKDEVSAETVRRLPPADAPLPLKAHSLQMLIYGDISPHSLHHLSSLADEVFAPLLTDYVSKSGWQTSIHDDVLSKFHEFNVELNVIKGKLTNQTLLSLPMNMNEVLEMGKDLVDGYSLHCFAFLSSLLMPIAAMI